MSKTSIISALSIATVLVFSSAGQAQTIDATPAEGALPPPLSITQRYVPPPKEKTLAPRAPLTLLVDDSSTVTAAAETVPEDPGQAPPPVVSEEVGNRPAIAALARGRLAITVSSGEHR